MEEGKSPRYENSRFNHEHFSRDLDAIRKFHRLDNQQQLANAIGVHPTVIARLTSGEGAAFDAVCKVLQWANLDLRDYLAPLERHVPASQQLRMTDD